MIGILTFAEANNYGAMLQAYALQQCLCSLDIKNELIRYRNENIWSSYHFVRYRGYSRLSQLKKAVELLLFLPKTKAFDIFREYLNITDVIEKRELPEKTRKYEKVIVGSDQVWNPRNTNSDRAFLLDFIDDNEKKIAYAASFGNPAFFSEFGEDAIELVKEIPCISVREESGKVFLQTRIPNTISVVCDPVFLLTKQQWEKIIRNNNESEYIFVYALTPNTEMLKYVKRLSHEEKLNVIVVPGVLNTIPPALRIKNCQIMLNAGPLDFVSLISNAKYIVTDSFHGTALSIIMEKNFVVFTKNSGGNTNSRIDNILDVCHLEDRKKINATDGCNIKNDIDYQVVGSLVNTYRNKSIQYIMKAAGI